MPTDFELSGQSNCGCTWHAEEGIPCVHDLHHALTTGMISVDDYKERMERLHPCEILFPETADLKNTGTGEPY